MEVLKMDKQTKENTYQTSLRIPMETYKTIEILAKESDRKVADQIRHMLKEFIRIKKS